MVLLICNKLHAQIFIYNLSILEMLHIQINLVMKHKKAPAKRVWRGLFCCYYFIYLMTSLCVVCVISLDTLTRYMPDSSPEMLNVSLCLLSLFLTHTISPNTLMISTLVNGFVERMLNSFVAGLGKMCEDS